MSWLDQFASPNGGGGATVGQATGRIVIDTASLKRSRAEIIRETRVIGDALKTGIGAGAEDGVKRAESAFTRLNTRLSGLTTGLSVLSAAATGFGVSAAQKIKALQARFTLLAGSQEKSAQLMDELRETAQQTNQPFLDVVEGAMALMPALRGTNASLSDTLNLVQRLAVLDPAQGVAGAAFAIREFLNGEYLSLVRRLEMDRTRLKAIRDEAQGDQAKAVQLLSEYVTEMGLGEDALKSFGQSGVTSFAVLRDEAEQTFGDVFAPFLNDVLIPMVRTFGSLLQVLRQLSPELKRFIGIAAGLGSMSALGRTLPLIGQIPGGATLGKMGVGAAVGYAGAQLGVAATRGLGAAGVGGFERFKGRSQADVGSELTERLKQVGVILVNALMWVSRQIRAGAMVVGNAFEWIKANLQLTGGMVGNALADIAKVLTGAIASFVETLAGFLESINTIDLGFLGKKELGTQGAAEDLRGFAEGLRNVDDSMRTGTNTMQEYRNAMARGISLTEDQRAELEQMETAQNELVISFGRAIGAIQNATDSTTHWERAIAALAGRQEQAAAPSQEWTISDELLTAWEDFQEKLAEIESDANQDRLDESEDYEAKRADLITSYQQQVIQLLEEESVRYQRALEETTRKESEIRANLADQAAEEDSEHQERIADLVQDYNDTNERAAEDHLRRLAQLERDGKQEIAEAAMKLDAVALWRAQKKMREGIEQEQDNYQQEQEERRKALERALAQEMASYNERLNAARVAADKQIQQLWEQFNREEQLNREDMARKLAQMQQAHQQELAQLAVNHQARLAQITADAARESQALEKEFIDAFNALQAEAGNHQATLKDIHRKGQAEIEADLRTWYKAQKAIVAAELGSMVGALLGAPVATVGGLLGATVGSQASGGTIASTGKYLMHQGEEVISKPFADTLRSMMGGALSQVGLVSAVASGGRGTGGVSVGQISVNVTGAGDPQATGQEVARQVKQVLWELVTG